MSGLNAGFAIAAALSALGVLVHGVSGAAGLGRALRQSSIAPAARGLLWICLHMVTLINITLTATFWWAAVNFQGRAAATAMTFFALFAAGLCLVGAIRGRLRGTGLLPAGLYLLIFLAGFWGCYGSFADMITSGPH